MFEYTHGSRERDIDSRCDLLVFYTLCSEMAFCCFSAIESHDASILPVVPEHASQPLNTVSKGVWYPSRLTQQMHVISDWPSYFPYGPRKRPSGCTESEIGPVSPDCFNTGQFWLGLVLRIDWNLCVCVSFSTHWLVRNWLLGMCSVPSNGIRYPSNAQFYLLKKNIHQQNILWVAIRRLNKVIRLTR